MVLCLVTLTDLYTRRAGFLSISWASCIIRERLCIAQSLLSKDGCLSVQSVCDTPVLCLND